MLLKFLLIHLSSSLLTQATVKKIKTKNLENTEKNSETTKDAKDTYSDTPSNSSQSLTQDSNPAQLENGTSSSNLRKAGSSNVKLDTVSSTPDFTSTQNSLNLPMDSAQSPTLAMGKLMNRKKTKSGQTTMSSQTQQPHSTDASDPSPYSGTGTSDLSNSSQ
jgi:hypothetical protein